jgi:hypothetical protein
MSYASEKFTSFVNQFYNQSLTDPAGYLKGECVSLTKRFISYLGLWYDSTWVGSGNNYSQPAFDLFKSGQNEVLNHIGVVNGKKYTTQIITDYTQLQAGDLVFTNTFTYSGMTTSHTGIANGSSNASTFQLFNQNWTGGDTGLNAGYDSLNKSLFRGAIRVVVEGDTGSKIDLQPTFNSSGKVDFNGDGKADILRQEKYADGIRDVEIYYSNGNSFGSPVTLSKWSWACVSSFAGGTNLIIDDFNGDGKSDILRQESIADNNSDVSILYSDGYNFNVGLNQLPDQSVMYAGFGGGTKLLSGDFNGDGKADILRQEKYADGIRDVEIYYSNGNSFGSPVTLSKWSWACVSSFAGGTNLIIDDFNGDGKDDILRQESIADNNSDVSILYSDGYNFNVGLNQLPDQSVMYAGFGGGTKLLSGDFNGDGKADILRQEKYADGIRDVEIYYSNGSVFNSPVTLSKWSWACVSSFAGGTNLIIDDFNGDGKDDILRQESIADNNSDVSILYSDGYNFNVGLNQLPDQSVMYAGFGGGTNLI